MQTQVWHLYLQDEAVRIGCGWRTVNVMVGRKWIRLHERATGHRGKLPVSMLPRLRYREVAVRKRRKRGA